MTDRLSTLRAGLEQARPGLALEFGVGSGESLALIAGKRPGETYGFDSFQGLPETWRPGFDKGRFACAPPTVKGASLVVGLFQDTLDDWLSNHKTCDVGLLHIDCDLYSSSSFVLSQFHHLEPGTVLVFDELVGYPGWQHHEHRALLEWVASTGNVIEPLAAGGESAAFRVT